jgi:hypothetical protein
MLYLKQSTAVTIMLGPFLDDGDGKTAETGLTISQADVRLSKNSGNMAQKNESTSCTHDEIGWYTCPLDTTDTNTLGILTIMVHESGALPVWKEYMVIPAAVYDSLVAGSDKLPVDAVEISGDSAAADALESYCDGTTPQPVNATQISGDATAADNLETYCDGGANMPVDAVKISGSSTAADNLEANIANLNAPVATVDTVVDGIATALATVDGIVDAILVDTAVIGAAGAGLTAVPWNAAWDAEVQSECADALNAYDPPTATELTSGLESLNDISVSDILAGVVEGTTTIAQALRGIMSVLFGKTSGSGSSTIVFRDIGDTKDRITMTIAEDRDRSAVTKDLT